MAEDPVETEAVVPEAPVPDPPPNVPGQASAQGTFAAVPPAGGPNDSNAHQTIGRVGFATNRMGFDAQPAVRPSNYKTRLCMKWQQQGHCAFGARCNFAHGMEDMRSQHQNDAALISASARYSSNTKVVNENRKTRLCTKFVQYGSCPYGDKCNFAHGVHELKNPPGMMPDLNGSGPHPASVRNNYKTRICLNWQNTGQCTYASRCNFAHGLHELRCVPCKPDKGVMRAPAALQGPQQPHQQQPQYGGGAMGSYGMMAMPFAMQEMAPFPGPVVPMGAGGMPFAMPPGMPPPGMDHFGQPGYMPQMHPVFSQVPPAMMNQLMQPYPTPSPGPVAPPMSGVDAMAQPMSGAVEAVQALDVSEQLDMVVNGWQSSSQAQQQQQVEAE